MAGILIFNDPDINDRGFIMERGIVRVGTRERK